ncbi:MAG: single-stranded-DNA-specific exonuclease RecJ [Lachnospiraceae bacterium]|nr:single-stranded-DNA-specific exonuclease RecJ [Lachnospiraceae bacterium]
MEKWIEVRKGGSFAQLGKKYGLDPVLFRILCNRGVVTQADIETYLYGGREKLHDPHLLKDGEVAAELLADAIAQGKKIRIIGDYDIDGVNASYILLKGLRRCGAIADAAIPDRMKDGYGINENLIQAAAEAGTELIMTCDNGIAALDAISFAKQKGMTVIVTDHHEIPYRMDESGTQIWLRSEADAIVNPKQQDCAYPYKELCGATVAWKVLQLLYEKMDIPVEQADEFIENVGFATVGDVMNLTGENRILVKLGLQALEQTKNPGMKALIAQTGLQDRKISSYHVGFLLGPCINASGRLDTARRSLALLMEEDLTAAAELARELVELNESRKSMTLQQTELAMQRVVEQGLEQNKVLVVYLEECHESLAGIIAGRLRERYHRPVIVLTKGEDGVKGSGRSIEEYSMFDELTAVAELFTKYGGHPMAAGMSLTEENAALLGQRLNENCRLTEDDLVEKVYIDVVMPMSYVTEELVYDLSLLEPCGKGNTKPIFAEREIRVKRATRVGRLQNVLKLQLLTRDNRQVSGIFYDDIDRFFGYLEEKFSKEDVMAMCEGRPNGITFSAIYDPSVNTYGGNREIQMIIRRYC